MHAREPELDTTSLIPPREMLFDGSSTQEEFVAFGEGCFQLVLLQRAQIQTSSTFLDLGCGNGSVARALTGFLTSAGRYEGLDINAASIEWLREHYRSFPNFNFTHANVYNKLYNPAGKYTSSEYRLPYQDSTFDMVLLKSVFTHMLPADVRNYVKEISRVLTKGGRAVITYFLLNRESRRFIDRGLDQMSLAHEYGGDALCRVANPDVPEAAVAHDEERVRGLYADEGLSLIEVVYGNWCGRPSLLGLQDLTIAIKE